MARFTEIAMADGFHVLLVDDEPDILEISRLSLELVGGWEVTTADSAEGLADLVRQVRPDLILLDVMMPGIDGPTAFKTLQASDDTSKFPVVFLTGKALQLDIEDLKSQGVLGAISKPFDPMTLDQQINKMMLGA